MIPAHEAVHPYLRVVDADHVVFLTVADGDADLHPSKDYSRLTPPGVFILRPIREGPLRRPSMRATSP